MCCGLVRPSARCNWCFSLWLKVEDEIFHLHHFIPSLPSLHPPILFSYSLCHPPPPSNQGLGSYCPLLMLSNGVFFRCCQTVWLSKFVIDHNSYWFLGSDCHCTSLFHASFLRKGLIAIVPAFFTQVFCSSLISFFIQVFCSSLFHTSFLLKSWSHFQWKLGLNNNQLFLPSYSSSSVFVPSNFSSYYFFKYCILIW